MMKIENNTAALSVVSAIPASQGKQGNHTEDPDSRQNDSYRASHNDGDKHAFASLHSVNAGRLTHV